MDEGRIDALIAALSEHADRSEEARKCAGYFTRNRLRWTTRRSSRWACASAAASWRLRCKTAVGVRMKRAGMHWTARGANAIAALRCCRLSGRYEDFWAWRVALEAGKAA